jgi:hypothetical protein
LLVFGRADPIDAPGADFRREEGGQGDGRGMKRSSIEAKCWPNGVGDFESHP